jgi:hypothetical protein
MYRYALRQEHIVLKYERAAFLIPCQGLRGYFAKFQVTCMTVLHIHIACVTINRKAGIGE